MAAIKLNYLIERAVLSFICLWGNWALYYWVMVLVFDASYTNLKDFAPLLLLQTFVSFFVFLRTDLGITGAYNHGSTPDRWNFTVSPDKRFYLLSLAATVLAVTIICIVDRYQLSRSSLSYNLLWAMLLPAALLYLFKLATLKDTATLQERASEPSTKTLDIILLFITAAAIAFSLYGTNFPSYDDSFYAHVISSTLANPELPIQGQDLLLGTDAPYTLHPAYRTVGYEVLIAFVSDLSGLNPLYLYLDIFPVVSSIFWILTAYLFMRTLGAPYPGLAVTVSLLVLLFWSGRYAPGMALMFLNWGKNLLMLVVAPLLFVFVATFIRSPGFRTWLLLLFSVSAAGIWSSTALFVVPMCVGLASITFLPSIKRNFRTLFFTLLSLTPFFLLLAYTIVMLDQAPANTSANSTGAIKVHGEAFGNIYIKMLILVMLFILPLAARTLGNPVFRVNLYRICVVGILTVMAPYMTEVVAVVTGINLLSVRLQYAYPATLLVGMVASIAVAHLKPYAGTPANVPARYAVTAFALIFYGALFGFMEKRYLFGEWRKFTVIFTDDFDEAVAARALIPNGSYVAAGDLDDILPILPNPPTFIQAKYYLNFHKYFLPEDEFIKRKSLHRTLKIRLPRKGMSLEGTFDWIVATAESLGVSTLVFHTVGGRHRPYIVAIGIPKRSAETDAKRAAFVTALTARLRTAGYDCATTPSGRSKVCHRSL